MVTCEAHLPHRSCVQEYWGWGRSGSGCRLGAGAGTRSLFLSLYFCVELTFSVINAKKCFQRIFLPEAFSPGVLFCLACSGRIPRGGITGSGSFVTFFFPWTCAGRSRVHRMMRTHTVVSVWHPERLPGSRAESH